MKIQNTLLTLIAVLCTTTGIIVQEAKQAESPVVTIFIHGSRPQFPEFFYRMGNYYFIPGLHSIDEYMALKELERPIGIIDGLKNSGYVDFNHFYLFGWSGRVYFDIRKEAAHELKEALEALLAEKYAGTKPKIHIITHSHGGNVALNLAHELEVDQSDIVIDELMLMAVPVQAQTKEYIKSNNLKKVYSHYSEDDWTQIIDPQGLWHLFALLRLVNNAFLGNFDKLFSVHTFDHHEKLTQLCIKINNKDPWHITFIDYYPPIWGLNDLPKKHPHKFSLFLPELGTIMLKAKDADTQESIKAHQQPVVVHIDTYKERGERIALSHPAQKA